MKLGQVVDFYLFQVANFYMCPSQRKKLEFINSFNPPEIGRYFLFFFSLHELRLFCMNWGCFAQIEVVLHRLRLPCTDWGCPAQIEVALHRLRLPSTDWGCHEQSEGRHHTFHLKSSLYIKSSSATAVSQSLFLRCCYTCMMTCTGCPSGTSGRELGCEEAIETILGLRSESHK